MIELEEALHEQEVTNRKLGEILVTRGLVSRPALTMALADQLGVELETEDGFGSGLWAQIARRHDRGLGEGDDEEDYLSTELENHLVGTASPARGAGSPSTLPARAGESNVTASLVDRLEVKLAESEQRLEAVVSELVARESEIATLKANLDALSADGSPGTRRPSRVTSGGFLAFVSFETGYAVFECEGAPPRRGEALELDDLGDRFVVAKVSKSPFPLDSRRCVYLEHAA